MSLSDGVVTTIPPLERVREWTLNDATTAVQAELGKGFGATKTMVEDGDHWQGGEGWVGPAGDANTRSRVLAAVSRQFTPVDVVNEVLDNAVNGLLAREAHITFAALAPLEKPADDATDVERATYETARAAQDTEVEQMVAAVAAWWDREKLWEKARLAAKRARWSGRGALRCWVPPARLVAAQPPGEAPSLPTGLPFGDALSVIKLAAPAPDTATVYVDPLSQRQASLFLFRDALQKEYAELAYVENGLTVIQVVGGTAATLVGIDVGGRLPVAEMRANVLITESVRRQQNRLNFFESNLVRVVEAAGFPERYVINAKPQGMWLEAAPPGPPLDTYTDPNGKTWYLHAVPRTLGASISTDLRGIETTGPTGGQVIATPSVVKLEPTNPQYNTIASEHARNTIYRSCRQGHLAMQDQPTPSGYSRTQARAAHEQDLENARGPLEGMLRDTIEYLIALASLMSPEMAGFLDRYRCVVTAFVDVGPPDPSEATTIMAEREKGLLSAESAMAALGVEDVTAEKERMSSQAGAGVDLIMRQAQAMLPLTQAGVSVDAAARLAGMTEEQVSLIVASNVITGPPAVGQ